MVLQVLSIDLAVRGTCGMDSNYKWTTQIDHQTKKSAYQIELAWPVAWLHGIPDIKTPLKLNHTFISDSVDRFARTF